VSTEAYLHLRAAHGFCDWSVGQLAEHYPAFMRGGLVDVVGLHERDHQEHAGEFDHERGETAPGVAGLAPPAPAPGALPDVRKGGGPIETP
jgi:hypothetical protein